VFVDHAYGERGQDERNGVEERSDVGESEQRGGGTEKADPENEVADGHVEFPSVVDGSVPPSTPEKQKLAACQPFFSYFNNPQYNLRT
jgi:hypothetical protein